MKGEVEQTALLQLGSVIIGLAILIAIVSAFANSCTPQTNKNTLSNINKAINELETSSTASAVAYLSPNQFVVGFSSKSYMIHIIKSAVQNNDYESNALITQSGFSSELHVYVIQKPNQCKESCICIMEYKSGQTQEVTELIAEEVNPYTKSTISQAQVLTQESAACIPIKREPAETTTINFEKFSGLNDDVTNLHGFIIAPLRYNRDSFLVYITKDLQGKISACKYLEQC